MKPFVMIASIVSGIVSALATLAVMPWMIVVIFGESNSLAGAVMYVIVNCLLAGAASVAGFYLGRWLIVRAIQVIMRVLHFFGVTAEPKVAGR
jgi:predicted membrane metal-binding protein